MGTINDGRTKSLPLIKDPDA
ncbi:hypothetical protein EMIT0194P_90001 [Pseudomonas serbica]